jgi:hypothetical protein
MNGLKPRERSSKTPSDQNKRKYWKVKDLQEGRRNIYAGDKSIRSEDAITVQIHNVRPRMDESSKADQEVLAFAISWPNGFSRRVLQQDLTSS